MRSFSLSSGTIRRVRIPPDSAPAIVNGSRFVYVSCFLRSSICATCLVPTIRARPVPGFGAIGPLRRNAAKDGGTFTFETSRNRPFSYKNRLPNLASQIRKALLNIALNTGSNWPGEELMIPSTSEVAVCCSSASERCPRASASSRVRASICFFNSISELGPLLTCAFAFVPVERSLRPRVGLFAPLRDKVTSSARLVDLCWLLQTSFDHLVGAGKHGWRNVEPERLC